MIAPAEVPGMLRHWGELAPDEVGRNCRRLADRADNDVALCTRLAGDARMVDVLTRAVTMSALEVRLTPEQLDQIADLVAERLRAPVTEDRNRWLRTSEAAGYLGIHPDTLRALVAKREIQFQQEAPGHSLHFKRDWLDAWRRR